MARRTDRKLLDELLQTHEPRVREAFISAIADLRNSATLRVFVERLERNDIPGALASLNLEPEAFARVERAILEAYHDGGAATVDSFPRVRDPSGQQIIYRWGVRNLPAEQEMRDHAARMVVGVTDDMREGIREVLSEGLSQGRNPWASARDVVGRRSRATNERVGGYLGLTQRQMQTVSKVRRAIAEGDVEGMRAYLDLSPNIRDRRFDRTIRKAINGEVALTADYADKVARHYAEGALDYRGRVVARHETMMALGKSRDDAYQQQIDAGKLDAQDVTLTWRKTPREHPRLQHIQMNGRTVPYGQPFVMPDGATLRYPLDPNGPARHTLSCMCRAEYSVDFAGAAVRRYRARAA